MKKKRKRPTALAALNKVRGVLVQRRLIHRKGTTSKTHQREKCPDDWKLVGPDYGERNKMKKVERAQKAANLKFLRQCANRAIKRAMNVKKGRCSPNKAPTKKSLRAQAAKQRRREAEGLPSLDVSCLDRYHEEARQKAAKKSLAEKRKAEKAAENPAPPAVTRSRSVRSKRADTGPPGNQYQKTYQTSARDRESRAHTKNNEDEPQPGTSSGQVRKSSRLQKKK